MSTSKSSEPSSSSSSSSPTKIATTNISLPPMDELESILKVAIIASKKAGDIIVNYKGGVAISNRKANSRDLLTEIDPLCEKTIRETVLESFPTHEFLGEEDVAPGSEASAAALDAKLTSSSNDENNDNDSDNDNDGKKYLWIVDPIDGTSNFVHGMPLCMPSIAITYNGIVVVGVIYDPHRNECFTSIIGKGAYMNDQKITVGQQDSMNDAIIAMGSPPGPKSLQMSLIGIKALMPKCRTIRMLGSAALMLAWVACGRLTVYWEYDLSSWDVAAGALLVREAGGKFTGLDGEEWTLRERKIMASCGKGSVHEEVLEVLNGVGVV